MTLNCNPPLLSNKQECRDVSSVLESKTDSITQMLEQHQIDNNDAFVFPEKQPNKQNRFNMKKIVMAMYSLNEDCKNSDVLENSETDGQLTIEGSLEMLPNGKSQKNTILLTWKKRFFRLHNGFLTISDENPSCPNKTPPDTYKIMGGKVEYENENLIILDDSRGNNFVLRSNDKTVFTKWKNALDSQVLEKEEQSTWMFPGLKSTSIDKKVLIVDLGTCSIRAGVYSNEIKLPRLFFPNVCLKDSSGFKIGFDAFNSANGSSKSSSLIFPLKNKNAIDKSAIDMDSIENTLKYINAELNINPDEYQILLVTPKKFTDKVNIGFIDMLLSNFGFKSVMLINQAMLILYSYNSTTGIIVNLSEKIDIIPMNNGIVFQNGVSNLAYGGSAMSEYLNSYVSRAHYNYVNDAEQYLVNYIKEQACYVARNYAVEQKKPIESLKWSLDLQSYDLELKNVELDIARFEASEGLFNPEIWGLDGNGIHKLIFKAIQSCSMDLRREMARSIYLAGGLSRIPNLVERLENELQNIVPKSLKVKVNRSPSSYHCSYLGAFKFISQPEYDHLLIKKDEWSLEKANCLRKWRML